MLATPETEALAPDTEGENEAVGPEPETVEAVLAACADRLDCAIDWLGLLRAVPREPVAAWANDCEEALDISQPDSARAWLLRTLADEAREEETCGENKLLEFAAVTVPEVFALAAAALEAELDALGALRAELLPSAADWAIDCAEAWAILWLGAAWALLWVITVEVAARGLEGDKALLAPEALTVVGEAALFAEADCADADADEGALRAALIGEADCAIDCADAALIVWLDSALGWPDCTVTVACEADGANALLAPEAVGELGDAALWAAADCAAELFGLLRAALISEADGAEDSAEAWVIV